MFTPETHPTTHNSYIISALPAVCIILFAIYATSWFNHTNFKSSPEEKGVTEAMVSPLIKMQSNLLWRIP